MLKQIHEGKRLRKRGPAPTVSDGEVLTIEIVGEFLGFDQDKMIFWFFKNHYLDWFPGLGDIHRTTFVRQAANLWKTISKLKYTGKSHPIWWTEGASLNQ
jgi:hypothetical protein